jgi:carboxymethylenebutenolidase
MADGLQDLRLTLPTDGGEMTAYEVHPAGPARGALIIFHGAFGPNAHVEELGRRFAAYGFQTLTPNFYHRTTAAPLSRGEAVDHIAVERLCKPHLNGLSTKSCTEDLTAAVKHLNQAGFPDNRIGVIGFCLGGSVAFLAGVGFALGAVVSFYGGSSSAVANLGFERSLVDMAPDLQTPYLGIFGDHDPIIPVPEVEQIRAALRAARPETEVVRYADASHGFHEDDLPELYHEVSAIDAEARAFAWIDRCFDAAC